MKDVQIVEFSPTFNGVTSNFTFHMLCNFVFWLQYCFQNLLVRFFVTFLSPEIAVYEQPCFFVIIMIIVFALLLEMAVTFHLLIP